MRYMYDRQKSEIDHLQARVAKGKLSRREFLSRISAMGLGAMAPGLYMQSALAAPKQGGRFRQGVTGGATSDVLDPGQILDHYMINLQFGQLRNNLTEVAPDGNLVPELAESWEGSNGAKTWNFKVRQGVEFHSGKSLTSEDVVDSVNHHLGEASKSAAKGQLNAVASVKADGKHGVVVELSGGDADFPFILTDYHLLICPSNGDGTIDWQSGIGTGGFSLVENNAGVRTLTKANPNYWKPNRRFFDEIETLQIADSAARENALRTGELDAMNNVSAKTADLLKRQSGIVVGATKGNKQVTLPMLTNIAPFDNNDVRTAIKYIVDREQWLKVVARGYGELGNDNPIGPANVYRATTDELPQRGYDPDKAKYHLKKAGLDSLDIKFHAAETGFGGSVDAGQMMAETARPAGINIDVVREPDDGYWSNVWMKKPFSACYWSGRPTENMMFSTVYAGDAAWNDTYWNNARFNELLRMGRVETNPGKRRGIYVEMQQLVHSDGGTVLPLFLQDIFAINDKVRHPEVIAGNWELDGCKAAERWWFA
jgi:peptide/nickel transport system substrate-binding protein